MVASGARQRSSGDRPRTTRTRALPGGIDAAQVVTRRRVSGRSRYRALDPVRRRRSTASCISSLPPTPVSLPGDAIVAHLDVCWGYAPEPSHSHPSHPRARPVSRRRSRHFAQRMQRPRQRDSSTPPGFYSTLASASAQAAAAVPAFIPPDATEVTIRSLPGHGQTLKFVSATPLDSALCHAGTLTGRPRINSNWWPTTPPPSSGMSCNSGWQLFTVDGVTYGWTSAEFSR